MTRNGGGMTGEADEHFLRDIFGPMRVAVELAKRRRVNEMDPAIHEFRERRFVALRYESGEQVCVGAIHVLQLNVTDAQKPPKRFSAVRDHKVNVIAAGIGPLGPASGMQSLERSSVMALLCGPLPEPLAVLEGKTARFVPIALPASYTPERREKSFPAQGPAAWAPHPCDIQTTLRLRRQSREPP